MSATNPGVHAAVFRSRVCCARWPSFHFVFKAHVVRKMVCGCSQKRGGCDETSWEDNKLFGGNSHSLSRGERHRYGLARFPGALHCEPRVSSTKKNVSLYCAQ
jgi:hypothetical protein